MEPDAPTKIMADEVQLTEAVEQVLGNAISFSPSGETIEYRACRCRDGGLCFQIQDRGPGVDLDRIEQMLSAFTQGETGSSRSNDGIGLGLVVSRAIMELHSGSVALSNRPDAGTSIELLLPMSRNR